jgi:hypothetical protein
MTMASTTDKLILIWDANDSLSHKSNVGLSIANIISLSATKHCTNSILIYSSTRVIAHILGSKDLVQLMKIQVTYHVAKVHGYWNIHQNLLIYNFAEWVNEQETLQHN